jgi:DNA polymerase III delta prime subunit
VARLPAKPADASPLEAALLDIARLALKGDVRAVRQRARNLLRDGKSAPLGESSREYLGRLLAEIEPVATAFRDSTPTASAPEGPPLVFPSGNGEGQMGGDFVVGPAPSEPGGGAALIEVESPGDAATPVLEKPAETALMRVVRERAEGERLRAAGVAPAASVLLSGPPGTGKTMAARFLARQLELPLLRLQPSAVMSSLMGQSSRNLREALRYAASAPAVLLLDEFDAYARRRDDAQDIAEPKRFVNVLLLELDAWSESSVLVAATNHPELLDPAIARRFEHHIELTLPTAKTRVRLVEATLENLGHESDIALLECCAEATDGMSGSELASGCRAAVRTMVLDGISLEHALIDRFVRNRLGGKDRASSRARERFAVHAHGKLGMSHRDIGRILDVSHVAVGQMIKRARSTEGRINAVA